MTTLALVFVLISLAIGVYAILCTD